MAVTLSMVCLVSDTMHVIEIIVLADAILISPMASTCTERKMSLNVLLLQTLLAKQKILIALLL